jgi:hypothetical protein
MLEFSILLLVILSIVWLAWKWRKQDRASKKATVEQAWRIVLDDPHYAQRRQYEEHKRAEEARLRKEAEGL